MKKQVLFIHGGEVCNSHEEYVENLKTVSLRDVFTHPQQRWSLSLRESLGAEFEVCMPVMPNKYDAQYADWKIWFERHLEMFHDGVILVGHSLGGIFLAKYLSENEFPLKIKSLYLIAAVAPEESGGLSGVTSFSFNLSDLTNLSKQVQNIHIFQSKDDFVVPFSHAEKYHDALPGSHLHTFEDRGHFLQEEFPELIEEIKGLG